MRSFARRSVFAAVVVLVALVARPSAADDAAVPLPAVSSGEGAPLFDQVDPRTGAMTYTYRFELPSARGLSGPNLGLQYNSSTRDREAGYAWGLDLPSIELRPLAGLARFDAAGVPLRGDQERYAYQGQSLVRICIVGGCPDEPSTQGHPDWASGWSYYRLQVEGLFARFYQSSDRQTWRVQFKGGEVVDFGAAVGEGYGMPTAVESNATGGIVRWHPVVRRDLQHPNNVIVYRWQPYGVRGILYLTDIYDTPSIAAPTSVGEFAHHVQLNWDGVELPAGNYQSPERAMPDFRLARVAVASMPWSGTGPREIYRVYTLDDYAPRGSGPYDPSVQGPLWHHSFLKQIRLEGHCPGLTENGDGTIGSNLQCVALPPVRFEYEPGASIGFVTDTLQIEGGPPGAANDFGVLPFPASATIVDFDRDGLPDVVQSWEGPQCGAPGRRMAVRAHGASGEPELYCIQGLDSDGNPTGAADYTVRSARPILGYLNRGMNGIYTGSFRYQCMDAGTVPAVEGLPQDSSTILSLSAGTVATQRNDITGFFNSGSNTVIGAFGSGLGIWGRNGYLPFFATSLAQPEFSPGAEPPNFALGGCHLDGQFDSASFFPRWRWDSIRPGMFPVDGWTASAPRAETQNTAPEWFVDVDGDGYADVLRPVTGVPGTSDRRGRCLLDKRVLRSHGYSGGDRGPTPS
jgi:hypothetical protein